MSPHPDLIRSRLAAPQGGRALGPARAQRDPCRHRREQAAGRRHAQGRRVEPRQGRALALPRRGPIRYDPPVVFVHSLVSRSYILDLRPGNSTVEFLLGEGFDVYMLDWGVPDERDAENTIETYVDEYLAARGRGRAARERQRGGDAGRLLPRRHVRDPLRGGPRGRAGPQPRPARDARSTSARWASMVAAVRRRAGSIRTSSSTRPATCPPTRSTAASTCRRRRRRSPSTRRC